VRQDFSGLLIRDGGLRAHEISTATWHRTGAVIRPDAPTIPMTLHGERALNVKNAEGKR